MELSNAHFYLVHKNQLDPGISLAELFIAMPFRVCLELACFLNVSSAWCSANKSSFWLKLVKLAFGQVHLHISLLEYRIFREQKTQLYLSAYSWSYSIGLVTNVWLKLNECLMYIHINEYKDSIHSIFVWNGKLYCVVVLWTH